LIALKVWRRAALRVALKSETPDVLAQPQERSWWRRWLCAAALLRVALCAG